MNPKRTELLRSTEKLYLKNEGSQHGGSYKMRGVHRLMLGKIPKTGFSTVSAGNLGRALAIACQSREVPCTIYLPESAPEIKKRRIKDLGAKIIELPFQEIWNLVLRSSEAEGFVHPVHQMELLEGYGTIADEILEDLPELNAVVVPFGLGGLALGLSERMKILNPKVKVFAAELATCAPLHSAFKNGAPTNVTREECFVDAIGTPEVLPFVYSRARATLSGSILVSLGETREALRELSLVHGLMVEGASAVAFAAAKKLEGAGKTVALLTGSNIDPGIHERECRLAPRHAEF